MNRLTSISIRSGSAVALAAVIALIAGITAAVSLKQELLPSFELPVAAVITSAPGSSVGDVERDITIPIERAIQDIPEIEAVTSMTHEGTSVIIMQTAFGTDNTDLRAEIRSRLDPLTLPDNASDPGVREISLDDFPVLSLSVTSDGLDAEELYAQLRSNVLPKLERVDGVSRVSLVGGSSSQLVVQPNLAKLQRLGLSPAAISAAVEQATLVRPLGALIEDGAALPLSVSRRLQEPDDIKQLAIAPQFGAPAGTTVADVATITTVDVPADTRLRVDGEAAIGLDITKLGTGNTVEVVDAVQGELDDALEQLPGDVTSSTIFDQAAPITEAIGGIVREGLLGILFATLVIFAFLRSARATLIAAVSIPLSLAIALVVLWQQGFTLNVLTLGALTIAVGRVVDDSIVVIENVHRHILAGDGRLAAAYVGTREVLPAITASTLTTIAVFGPIAMVGGIAQQLFAPFALTVVIALLASLLVAITLVPYLASRGAGANGTAIHDAPSVDELTEQPLTRLERLYQPLLRFSLKRRWITVLIGAVVLVASIVPVFTINQTLFDQSGAPVTQVLVQMPPGSTLDDTQDEVSKVSTLLEDAEWVDEISEQSGVATDPFAPAGTVPADPTQGMLVLVLDAEQPSDITDQIQQRVDSYEGPAEVGLMDQQGGIASSNSISISLLSTDDAALTKAAEQVATAAAKVKDLSEVQSDVRGERSELRLVVNEAAASRAGLTAAQLAETIGAGLAGGPLGSMSIDGASVDVVMAPSGPGAIPTKALLALEVPTSTGSVRVGDVATVESTSTVATINRTDGSRSATITATVTGDDLVGAQADLDAAVDKLDLPDGVSVNQAGAFEDLQGTFNDLLIAMAAAVLLVYLVTVATFRSLLKPLILLVSIPLSLSGAFGALLVTGSALSVPALIGMLMLIGIVVTNAIVMLDLVERHREQGASVEDALRAGATRRLRPVLMTALATMGALAPLALGLGGVEGSGGFISAPLAIVVIGGLMSSTLLTLVVVPALYSLTGRFTRPRQGRRVMDELEAAASARGL